MQWILDTTEKWCRDRAIYIALMESIHIADGKNDKKDRDAIPSILQEALAIGFDNNIGHYESNTCISCLKCNLQRRTDNYEYFKNGKQLKINIIK
jgi:hypothetical protein